MPFGRDREVDIKQARLMIASWLKRKLEFRVKDDEHRELLYAKQGRVLRPKTAEEFLSLLEQME